MINKLAHPERVFRRLKRSLSVVDSLGSFGELAGFVSAVDDSSGVDPVGRRSGEVSVERSTGEFTLVHTVAHDLGSNRWLHSEVRVSDEVDTDVVSELSVVVVPGELDKTSSVESRRPVSVLASLVVSGSGSVLLDRSDVGLSDGSGQDVGKSSLVRAILAALGQDEFSVSELSSGKSSVVSFELTKHGRNHGCLAQGKD